MHKSERGETDMWDLRGKLKRVWSQPWIYIIHFTSVRALASHCDSKINAVICFVRRSDAIRGLFNLKSYESLLYSSLLRTD